MKSDTTRKEKYAVLIILIKDTVKIQWELNGLANLIRKFHVLQYNDARSSCDFCASNWHELSLSPD